MASEAHEKAKAAWLEVEKMRPKWSSNRSCYTEAYEAAYAQGISDKDAAVAEAKIQGGLDVLMQIRVFRKAHVMDAGIQETMAFIGTLHAQYNAAVERLSTKPAESGPKAGGSE